MRPPETNIMPENPKTAESACDDLLAVFGLNLPIMAKLPKGFFLVAHENGPAIANEHLLSALEYADEEIPERVREIAISELSAWASKQPTFPANEA